MWPFDEKSVVHCAGRLSLVVYTFDLYDFQKRVIPRRISKRDCCYYQDDRHVCTPTEAVSEQGGQAGIWCRLHGP